MREGPYEIELAVEPLRTSSALLTEKSLPERRGYGVIDAVDPTDGKLWDIRVSNDYIDRVVRRSRGQALELARCLPEVLEQPTAIFQGIREEGEDDWLCYCGRPSNRYSGRDGHRLAVPFDEVYLAFVDCDRVMYLSRWDHAAPPNYRWPVNHRTRFGRRVL